MTGRSMKDKAFPWIYGRKSRTFPITIDTVQIRDSWIQTWSNRRYTPT